MVLPPPCNPRTTKRPRLRIRRPGEAAAASLTLVAAAAVLALAAEPASAWSRHCRWPTSGVTTIPIWVTCDSFAPYGYDCDVVQRIINAATVPWNTQGGTDVRLGTAQVTSSWGPISGAIWIRMLPEHSNPGVFMLADYRCTDPAIAVFANWFQSSALYDQTGADVTGSLSHELGHTLGFQHSNDGASGCGGVPYAGRALMAGGGSSRARSLWLDEWQGLIGGPTGCPYVPTIPSGTMRVQQTPNGGASWSSYLTWGQSNSSNMSPGMAWGWPTGGGDSRLLQTVADRNHVVHVWTWTPAPGPGWGHPVTNGGTALAGPAAAWSLTRAEFLVCFPLMTSMQEGAIRCLRSSNGTSFTTFDNPALLTQYRVGLAWNAARGKYYMVYSQFPGASGDPAFSGRLLVTWSADGQTWSTPFPVPNPGATDPLGLGHYAAGGPGLSCPPTEPQGRCWAVYPDARVPTNTLRELVFLPQGDGTVDGTSFSQNFSFPAWNSRWITSRFDVAATHDNYRTDVVYGFREQNTARSGVGVWLEDDDTNPPPGFGSGEPPSPGFNSGGQALSGVLAGPALAVNVEASPNVVYLMAHSE